MLNKLFEGKTPAERNKTIAAMVLGLLAVTALSYSFFFSGSPRRSATTPNNNANANKSAIRLPQNSAAPPIVSPDQARNDNPFEVLTPLPDDPYAPVFADAPSRNIFVLYDPSQNPPPLPKPSPLPTPTPVPTPPQFIAGVNPSSKYSGERDFTLEVYGDKFTPETKILFQGMEIPTQYGGTQRLTGKVSASQIMGEGQRQIFVRTPDGKLYSNNTALNVQAPPLPNYNYVGLVARKRYNNDTVVLQDKTNKQQFQNARLGETVGGRFKIVSISTKEVVMQDVQLSFRHSLPFLDEKMAGTTGGAAVSTRPTSPNPNDGFGNVQFQTIQPGQYIPGITQQPPPQPQQQPSPGQKPEPPSDDDEDNN